MPMYIMDSRRTRHSAGEFIPLLPFCSASSIRGTMIRFNVEEMTARQLLIVSSVGNVNRCDGFRYPFLRAFRATSHLAVSPEKLNQKKGVLVFRWEKNCAKTEM
jgi:hypothetical protein